MDAERVVVRDDGEVTTEDGLADESSGAIRVVVHRDADTCVNDNVDEGLGRLGSGAAHAPTAPATPPRPLGGAA